MDNTRGLAARIEPLLEFLPQMESRVAGEWQGGEQRPDGSYTAQWMSYSAEVLAFIRACGESAWLQPYDWMAWIPEADRYFRAPATLSTAGVETIRKLLTLHVRRDRFYEGHLATVIESGHIAAILRRLAEIRRQLVLEG